MENQDIRKTLSTCITAGKQIEMGVKTVIGEAVANAVRLYGRRKGESNYICLDGGTISDESIYIRETSESEWNNDIDEEICCLGELDNIALSEQGRLTVLTDSGCVSFLDLPMDSVFTLAQCIAYMIETDN